MVCLNYFLRHLSTEMGALYLESLERRYAQFSLTGKVSHQFSDNPTSGDTASQGRVNE